MVKKCFPLGVALLWVFASLAVPGCSGSSGRLAVSGKVTLDGKPLDSGMISFRPAAGTSANSSGGQITDGSYVLPAQKGLKPGKYLVTVQAFRKTGKMVDDPQMGRIPDMEPVKFKEAGSLKATVEERGSNTFDFHLTTAGGR
jgi:hypothetical protein